MNKTAVPMKQPVRNRRTPKVSEMPTMQQCEELLLEQAVPLYHVALALTDNPQSANRLTRQTLSQAWMKCPAMAKKTAMKSRLLSMLRQNYLAQDTFRSDIESLEQNATEAGSFEPIGRCHETS
jgi:hypothetical protein